MTPDRGSTVALALVDVIKAFYDPQGSFYYPAALEALEGTRRLLDAARAGGRLIVHARDMHREGLTDFEELKLPRHCVAGGLDAEFVPGFEPAEGEVEIHKRRFSAFYGTDMELVLREQGVRGLLVTGVKTNVCIRATVQDAFAAGFETILARGSVNSNRTHLHEASLEDVERYMGRVVELEEGERILRQGTWR